MFAACSHPQVQKPVWVNPAESIEIPAEKMIFKAPGRDWEAALISFTQPVPLKLSYTDSGFVVYQANQSGVTEGQAQILLKNNSQYFLYPVKLLNKTMGAISEKDYRSPKTVNPDSSLNQQSVFHAFDHWRNLVPTSQNGGYFKEKVQTLDAREGTFRAIEEEPITAYYVQPGSCTDIPLQAGYEEETRSFRVTAGPLMDAFGNTTGKGTLVRFIYKKNNGTWQMESALQNGYTTVHIPANKGEMLSLFATVQQTKSPTLNLTAK